MKVVWPGKGCGVMWGGGENRTESQSVISDGSRQKDNSNRLNFNDENARKMGAKR